MAYLLYIKQYTSGMASADVIKSSHLSVSEPVKLQAGGVENGITGKT